MQEGQSSLNDSLLSRQSLLKQTPLFNYCDAVQRSRFFVIERGRTVGQADLSPMICGQLERVDESGPNAGGSTGRRSQGQLGSLQLDR